MLNKANQFIKKYCNYGNKWYFIGALLICLVYPCYKHVNDIHIQEQRNPKKIIIKLDPGQKLIRYEDGRMLTRSMHNDEHWEWYYYTDECHPGVIIIIQEQEVPER